MSVVMPPRTPRSQHRSTATCILPNQKPELPPHFSVKPKRDLANIGVKECKKVCQMASHMYNESRRARCFVLR